ncbi:hypothetical protein CHS0354_039401 [Potamilus streckersoni]|uniref:PKD/REJ-like domain-containing protein n=1 Tax=Potamilus streckersoni TaxID=2493646 RepID=A0AAE0S1Y4_9BIVA|nr:hypothetical protein CHS0354_039401 [Potamilus streckersoni]
MPIDPCRQNTTAVFSSTVFETTGVNNGLILTVDFANRTGTAVCINDLGDGIATLNNLSDTSSPWIYKYQYMVPNFYDVYITCHSDQILTTDNKTLYFGDAIEGMDITNGTNSSLVAFFYPAENFTLDLYVEKGSNLTFNVSYINTFEGKNGSNFVSFNSSLLPNLGLYQINVTVSNPISNASDFVVMALQEPIQDLKFTNCCTCSYVKVNVNFTLDFTLGFGSDVSFIINQTNAFNITQKMFTHHCSDIVRNSSISYPTQETGIYNFEIEISNYINTFNPIKQFIQIIAVNSVNNISFTIENPIHFYNETMRYALAVDWSALVPMGPISCNVTFGNGNFTITSFNLDVTNLTDVAIGENSSSLASIQKSFTYGLAGFYKSIANCFIDPTLVNCSSSGNFDKNYIIIKSVIVVNPVKNIHLLNESNYIPLSTGLAVISVVLDSENDLPLANITCIFNFGGETNKSMVGTVDAVSNITAEHKFLTYGNFNIIVICFNNLSSMEMNLTVEVYMDCFVTPFFDEPFKNIQTPVWTYVTDSLEVAPLVEASDLCKNKTAVYKWNMYLNTAETLEYNPPFDLQNKSVLIFPAQSVAPHTQPYKVVLNVSFSSGEWFRDYIYVDFRLPSLVAMIDGGLTLIVPYLSEKTSTIDASLSHDPVTNITSINNISLNYSWRCYFLGNATDDAVLAYLTQISSSSIISNDAEDINLNETDFPGVTENCSITDQSAAHKSVTCINTFLRENFWTLFVFKITRNSVFNITRNRISIALKALKAVPGEIVPVAIK